MKTSYQKILILILIVITTCKCEYKTKTDSNKLLTEYNKKLSKLDTSKMESISLATKLYTELFEGQSPIICDSAFFQFNNLAENIVSKLNEKHEKDTADFWSLFIVDENNTPPVIPNKLLSFNTNLKKNGLQLNHDDVSTWISIDGDFIETNFYQFLSNTLVKYLKQINYEDKNPYEIDAGLLISPQELCDRIMWWNNFILQNPNFEYLNYAVENKKNYTSILFSGSDNTPLIDIQNIDNKIVIAKYYNDARTYLNKKYPESFIEKKLNSYHTAIQSNNLRKAKEIISELKNQKVINDYIEEVELTNSENEY